MKASSAHQQLAYDPLRDELLRPLIVRPESAVTPDHELHARFLAGVDDVPCFGIRDGERFFNHHMYARLRCRNRDVAVQVVWGCNHDTVEFCVFKHRSVVGEMSFSPPFCRGCFYLIVIRITNGNQFRLFALGD